VIHAYNKYMKKRNITLDYKQLNITQMIAYVY
jgi:hypothetical protein